MRNWVLAAAAAVASMFSVSAAAQSAVPAFVGKGDVQTFYGWNDKQLQTSADHVGFRIHQVTTNEWTCENSRNEHQQLRNNETTVTAVIDTIGRENKSNRVTGFFLQVGPLTERTTNGPPTDECPSGWWYLADSYSSSDGGLEITNNNGSTWRLYSYLS